MIRKGLTWLALIASLILFIDLAPALINPAQLVVDDYVEYWSAGHLNLMRGNPYDPAQMAQAERQIGRLDHIPLMMLNPPWALPIVMPFALFSYPISRTVWFLVSIILVFGCASAIWSLYSGAPGKFWVAWLIAFTMGPILQLLKMGQISALLLLSTTGFLYFHQKKKAWLAGVFVAFLFIKPHVLYLFLAAYLVWCIQVRGWRYIAGTLVGLLGALLVAWMVNPAVIGQYLQSVTQLTLVEFEPATWGALLRMIFGYDQFWLQYLPSMVGLIWFLGYWWKNRRHWEWIEQLPLITFISAITTAYGWVCDLAIILLPMVFMGVTFIQSGWTVKKGIRIGIYLLINGLAAFLRIPQVYFCWLSAAYLIIFWMVKPAKNGLPANLNAYSEGSYN